MHLHCLLSKARIKARAVLSLLLVLLLCVPALDRSVAADGGDRLTEVEAAIEKGLAFYKSKWSVTDKKEEFILNSKFLTESNVGETSSDWIALVLGRYKGGYNDHPTMSQENYFNTYVASSSAKIQKAYTASGTLSKTEATEWQRKALGILAMGGDPTDVGEYNGKSIDLIRDGVYNSIVEPIDKGGINGVIFGLIALNTKDYEIPAGARYTSENLIKYLANNQLADGTWEYGSSSRSAAAADTTFYAAYNNDAPSATTSLVSEIDADITGMAIQALAPYYYNHSATYGSKARTVKEMVDLALDGAAKQQFPEGDFGSTMGTGGAAVESTAQILVALCSLGIDPETDDRFITASGKTLIDAILRYQKDDGSFHHAWDGTEFSDGDSMSTEQALYALESYRRFKANERNLYDFRPETNRRAFLIEVGEVTRTLSVAGGAALTLEVPLDTKNIRLLNIPMGPYDSASQALHTDIAVSSSPLEVKISDRRGNVTTYTITIKPTNDAVWKGLDEDINNLPAAITLKDKDDIQKLRARYEALSAEEKAKLANYKKLEDAWAKILSLETAAETELEERQEELLSQFKKLPSTVYIPRKNECELLRQNLEALSKKEFAAKDAAQIDKAVAALKKLLADIEEQEAAVLKLAEDIWNAIQPTSPPTLADETAINALKKRYDAIPEDNKSYIKANGMAVSQDLENAVAILEGLKKGVIPKVLFEMIKGLNTQYSYSGSISGGSGAYTVTFSGKKVTTPVDYTCGLSASSSNDAKIKKLTTETPVILSFTHAGSLPGSMDVKAAVSLSNGEYMLYRYDESADKGVFMQSVTVKDREAAFSISATGDYFLVSKTLSSSGGGSNNSSNNTLNNNNSDSDDIKTEYTDTIPKSAFEKIKGQDINIKVTGKTNKSTSCSFIFNGKDVVTPVAFHAGVTFVSSHEDNIKKLSEDPCIVSFEQKDAFPGKALFEVKVDLAGGDYLAFRYDDDKQKAVFVEKVSVSGGSVKFVVDSCSDYFVAKRAVMDGLSDLGGSAAAPSASDVIRSAMGNTQRSQAGGSGQLDALEESQPELTGKLADSILNQEEGVKGMPVFTADEVLTLLGAALDLGSASPASFLTPIAILIGAAMICVCIILLNRSNQKRLLVALPSVFGAISNSGGKKQAEALDAKESLPDGLNPAAPQPQPPDSGTAEPEVLNELRFVQVDERELPKEGAGDTESAEKQSAEDAEKREEQDHA